MKRTLMQVYVKNSVEAVKLYVKAFDAQLVAEYTNDDGSYMHAEIDVEGQIIAVSEASENTKATNMQFCLQFDDGAEAKIDNAFNTLHGGELTYGTPAPCSFSSYMSSFVDKFGIFWCLFI